MMITDEPGSIRLKCQTPLLSGKGEAETNSIRESKLSLTRTFLTGIFPVLASSIVYIISSPGLNTFLDAVLLTVSIGVRAFTFEEPELTNL